MLAKVICIVGVALLIVGSISFFGFYHTGDDITPKTQAYIYSGDSCDSLVHKDVPYAICYKEGEIVETIRRGNLYRATVTTPKSMYDYVEVYNGMGKGLINTYEGALYFDIKPRCA